eukprot:TRINITY_DN2923_c0_g1_i1.p1 TRINITY_DN2923_c0_g1~~TRINITY_DN2923_c0_g1_i1.p1  ORF type:complete len:157 (+),score=39.88 TRINITY_DN2923_c0_g1_i1:115-585(+)
MLRTGRRFAATAAAPILVTGLRVRKGRDYLFVTFNDSDTPAGLPAEYLRVYTSSADRTGHTPDQRKVVAGKKGVTIENLYPVGNYAVTIEFSDGHKSGIYGWDYLHELSAKKYHYMRLYLRELREMGKARRVVTRADTPSLVSKVLEKVRAKRKAE